MEKDIDRIPKNQETDIVIRIDDFGGRVGLTIREFVKSEKYTGFTKAGTRIPADQFKNFKAAINSIKEEDFQQEQEASEEQEPQEQRPSQKPAEEKKQPKKKLQDAPEEMEM
ncbi:hypothetical protein CO038_04440 [Candidatus Pacearchaeota archaeon CG_4_9_14_0_2_um_filter_39_13]|nr:hypothetical protein [Candidatus Pacearchaeota archaeon]OIO42593.1 MAG: hypothetical protein AUJ64_03870 [Candidatus Pacearchaeota archaeon CG1_02_39_14]PJC44317.1 MAG: hypothetical protein CO038_04440 [Candidatus Pacearchaeota archaeon CG_4_9_14_0_2_um_filter_39_13]